MAEKEQEFNYKNKLTQCKTNLTSWSNFSLFLKSSIIRKVIDNE